MRYSVYEMANRCHRCLIEMNVVPLSIFRARLMKIRQVELAVRAVCRFAAADFSLIEMTRARARERASFISSVREDRRVHETRGSLFFVGARAHWSSILIERCHVDTRHRDARPVSARQKLGCQIYADSNWTRAHFLPRLCFPLPAWESPIDAQ